MHIVLTFDLHAIPVKKGQRRLYRPYTKISKELLEIGYVKETKNGYALPQNTYIKKVPTNQSKATSIRNSETSKVKNIINNNWLEANTTIYFVVGKYWASKRT